MLNSLKSRLLAVWNDIRRFQNLELYFIILVILAIFIIDIFGEPSESAFTEILLAAIAILIYGQIEFRQRESEKALQLNRLSEKIDMLRNGNDRGIKVYAEGRVPDFDFTSFFFTAKKEIYIIGISTTNLRQRFTEQSSGHFKEPIFGKIAEGLNIYWHLLDPETESAKSYALDRAEPEMASRINMSQDELTKIVQELSQQSCNGTFSLYTYPRYPYCYLIIVDPLEPYGQLIVSHYLLNLPRRDTPIYQIEKASDPILFDRYFNMAKDLNSESKLIASNN